jgi:hypothetical protein
VKKKRERQRQTKAEEEYPTYNKWKRASWNVLTCVGTAC